MRFFGRENFGAALLAGAVSMVSPSPIAAAPPVAVAPAAPASILSSHRALYQITLTSTQPGGAYLDVNGAMFYDFTDGCDVWTTNQKFVLRTFDTEGKESRSDSDYTASESKAGDNYTFLVRKTQDSDAEELRGHAKREADGTGTAEFIKPQKLNFKLVSQFLFPSAQTIQLIEHTKTGDRFFSGSLFDGTQTGGAAKFNAIILKKPEVTSAIKHALLKAPAHRIRIAFFPVDSRVGKRAGPSQVDLSGQPDYEQTMTIHENGVISDMDVNLGDYSVHYRLQAIEAKPRPHC